MGLIEWEVQKYFWFNFRLKDNNYKVESLAKSIAQNLDFGTRKIPEKFEYLKCLLLNLKISWDTKRYIAISLSPNNYSKSAQRYRREFQNYRTVANVINEMLEYGYIDFVKGYKDIESDKRVPSKIKAKEGLGRILTQIIQYDMFQEIRPNESIILRDKDKKDIDYRDTELIKKMRQELNKYNDLRENSKIVIQDLPYSDFLSYKTDIQPFAKVSLRDLPKRKTYDIEIKNTYLSRIFNNKSFKHGGRYYRGVESVLPEEVRKYITIDDRQTCELDYSGLHIRMTYNIMGFKIESDPYTVSSDQKSHMRDFYKIISLIMLNSVNEKKALKGIVNEYRGSNYWRYVPNLKHDTLRPYCNAFIEAHKEIRSKFYKGLGIKFQNIDSNISSRIIKHFTDKNILVLCIHDSFIINSQYKDELKELMEREYLAEFPGFPPIIK